jgi:UDP-N-acetylmuramoyl-L-alanyl-D-glutamate--2,6-diaminopimelate ligase
MADASSPARSIRLAALAEQLRARLGRSISVHAGPGASGDPEIHQIVYDSRRAGAGSLFCCVPGQQLDGHAFAGDAVARGAVALLVEHRLDADVAQVEVPDARLAMAEAAAIFWGDPSRELAVVGVTGTNGKTTVSHLLGAVLSGAGWPCPVLGTLSGNRTTPEAPDLQEAFAAALASGARAVAMEVSSHALALERVAGTHFAVAVFTNLGLDHLDFHGTEAAYFAAKARLFEAGRSDRGVVNLDDPHGRLLRDAAVIPTVGYSLADVDEVRTTARGTAARWSGHDLWVPLPGRHNLSNALAAATAARQLGLADTAIVSGLAVAPPVPGRFEAVDVGQPFGVVVDYAHTPDALARALEAAREVTPPPGRVLVVFGCGGDRDRSKRAPMAAVASRSADVVVVTSDNPRSEDPRAIVEDVRAGLVPTVAGGARALVEVDRRAAIALALGEAGPGDLVLLAGKGHETTQDLGGRVVPFDDRVVAAELLGGSAPGRPGGAAGSRS